MHIFSRVNGPLNFLSILGIFFLLPRSLFFFFFFLKNHCKSKANQNKKTTSTMRLLPFYLWIILWHILCTWDTFGLLLFSFVSIWLSLSFTFHPGGLLFRFCTRSLCLASFPGRYYIHFPIFPMQLLAESCFSHATWELILS